MADRVALVTGAASGMGRATAHVFADEGAAVAVTDVTSGGVDAVVKEIVDSGGTAHGWVLDVSDPVRVQTVIDEVAGHFGRLDILVNNAGISRFGAIDSPDYEEIWAESLDVLITAHVRTIRAALPHLRQSDAARIVNIASTEALGATKFGSPYTAAKTAVTGLTRSLAVELGKEGNITVNCICPGAVRTGMTAAIDEDAKTEFARRRIPLNRYADPEEVAQMTVSLCLPAASYLNGAVIPVDAGLTIKNA